MSDFDVVDLGTGITEAFDAGSLPDVVQAYDGYSAGSGSAVVFLEPDDDTTVLGLGQLGYLQDFEGEGATFYLGDGETIWSSLNSDRIFPSMELIFAALQSISVPDGIVTGPVFEEPANFPVTESAELIYVDPWWTGPGASMFLTVLEITPTASGYLKTLGLPSGTSLEIDVVAGPSAEAVLNLYLTGDSTPFPDGAAPWDTPELEAYGYTYSSGGGIGSNEGDVFLMTEGVPFYAVIMDTDPLADKVIDVGAVMPSILAGNLETPSAPPQPETPYAVVYDGDSAQWIVSPQTLTAWLGQYLGTLLQQGENVTITQQLNDADGSVQSITFNAAGGGGGGVDPNTLATVGNLRITNGGLGIGFTDNNGDWVTPITWLDYANTLQLGTGDYTSRVNMSLLSADWGAGGDGWNFRIDSEVFPSEHHFFKIGQFQGGNFRMSAGEAGAPVLWVRGASTQSADLQQWLTTDGTTDTVVARVTEAGDIELETPGAGIIMTSPNGTKFRHSVSDAGASVWTAV